MFRLSNLVVKGIVQPDDVFMFKSRFFHLYGGTHYGMAEESRGHKSSGRKSLSFEQKVNRVN